MQWLMRWPNCAVHSGFDLHCCSCIPRSLQNEWTPVTVSLSRFPCQLSLIYWCTVCQQNIGLKQFNTYFHSNINILTSVLLGRVALVTGVAAYSDQTFPWTICRSVRRCVGLYSAVWKNGGSDPDAVWHHRSDGSRDEAGAGIWGSVHRKGYFWERIWGAPL